AALATAPACVAMAGEDATLLLPDVAVAGNGAVIALWALWLAAQAALAWRRRDVYQLALAAFSAWSVALAWLLRLGRFDDVVWALAGLAVIGLALIAWLLLHRHRAWRAEEGA
ncbi:hypothetical protein, partial [Chitiniphilus shinanonensis]